MQFRFLALAALFLPSAVLAAPVTPDDLLRHIRVLASDEYEGREPGTEGERKTIAYISGQLESIGLEPAGKDGGWYQPVPLVARKPTGQTTRWAGKGTPVSIGGEDLVLVGRSSAAKVEGAPVVFAGHGAVLPQHGIDQLAGAPIEGAVVLIQFEAPNIADFPPFNDRVKAVAARGAAAVIGIISDDRRWRAFREVYGEERARLESDPLAAIQGIMSQPAVSRLVAASGTTLETLLNGEPGPAFKAVPLALKADLEVQTAVRPFVSNNVVGRLKGKGGTGESVLFLGHWDHLGICRPENAPDRICNGAVDNASGIAVLIEVARGLAKGKRPKRDMLFLATTNEEGGLLGAEHFAADPPVPLASIVAAFNFDTVAISPRGRPVAVLGRGLAALDSLIADSVREAGRRLDEDHEADSFVTRQDGWELRARGVPSVMVGGSFSNMQELGAFLSGPYHQPSDDLQRPIELGGAAEDADLLIRIGRKAADPSRYRPGPAQAGPQAGH